MKASKELDALVVEKVMGWKKIPINFRGLTWMWDRLEGCHCDVVQIAPPFSTDIAAAWEVVEKLSSKGFQFSLVNRGSKLDLWDAEFCNDIQAYSHHDSYPVCVAICLAALKSVGYEFEEDEG